MIVLFNDIGEFLAEMGERGPNVDRVVRITVQRRHIPNVWKWRLKIVATYLRGVYEFQELRQVQTIRLESTQGEIGSTEIRSISEDQETEARLRRNLVLLEEVARKGGYTVAAGQYIPSGPKGGEG
jgi:hypothetical protein